ncbi:histidine phosphatase family protein [Nocardioides aequoreus]|uniref:histidine phosphatase family protein n=1 Tax=Nocardioides aequoreus TaxID=397278 RepID=UPI0004C37819|nr:histidine phosphatase family protein [Nocardioides aequoreus]
MRCLYLVRHGETSWNAERRLQGRHDVSLSPVGVMQAESLRPVLRAVLGDEVDRPSVVVSPLRRARQTCELLGLDDAVVDERWQEADLGSWTGRTRGELVAEGNGSYAAWRAGSYSPPGAEPQHELHMRVEAAIADAREGEHVVVVTHGGPIRAVCRQLLGLRPDHLVPVQPGSVTVLDLMDSRARLKYFNLAPVVAHQLAVEPSD